MQIHHEEKICIYLKVVGIMLIAHYKNVIRMGCQVTEYKKV